MPFSGIKKHAQTILNPPHQLIPRRMTTKLFYRHLLNQYLQALYVEKALAAAAGTNPEDFAKIMLIQSFLVDKGVGPDLLLQALLDLIDDDEMSSIGDMALKALRVGNFSIDELQKMLATSKALHGGKIRGMKEIGMYFSFTKKYFCV